MRIRTAVVTGLAGLVLSAGAGTAFAQPGYIYQNYQNRPLTRRYVIESRWEARQIVREAYLDILRREPDPSGWRQYTDAMLRRGWSEADVRRSLLTSDEYRQRFGRPVHYSRYYRGWRYR